MLSLDLLLSDELWQKWENSGFQGTGIDSLEYGLVRVNDLETASINDLAFGARERQPLGIIITLSNNKSIPNLPAQDFSFRIFHEASDASQVINPSSSCIFKVTNLKNQLDESILTPINLTASPNPFYQNTSITFSLPNAMPISLAVYDISGKRVHNLLDFQMLSVGKHEFNLLGQNLPEGLYFITLHTSEKAITQKVLKI